MQEPEFESAPSDTTRPRTATVLGLLAMTAATLSYLGAYAMTSALVAAEVLKPWAPDRDPRPKWFLMGFVILVSVFSMLGLAARQLSSWHLRQIEAMEHDE